MFRMFRPGEGTAPAKVMKHRRSSALEPCIYCGSDLPPRASREHVISQALGTYEQNWTLDGVCDECSFYFSRELELPLGRDSIEALLRIDKSSHEDKKRPAFAGLSSFWCGRGDSAGALPCRPSSSH